LTDDKTAGIERRSFLAGALASLYVAGCGQKTTAVFDLPDATQDQRAQRRTGRSSVAIVEADAYEEDLFAKLKQHIGQLQLPNLQGKHVVIKPNMVEFAAGHPVTTHPLVIKAAAQLVDYLGAKEITIAEGPGHMRDTEYLLASTGIGAICADLGLPFVDLNLDDIESRCCRKRPQNEDSSLGWHHCLDEKSFRRGPGP
jgi:hypothetical protein